MQNPTTAPNALTSMGGGAPAAANVGASIMDVFGSSPFSGYASDMGDIEKQMQQWTEKGAGYYQPFYSAGTAAIPQYQARLGQMADPTAFFKSMMSGYQESPLSQFQRQQGMQDINSAAASRGLLGSTAQGRNLLDFSQNLSAKDMEDYFKNLMGINTEYMGGLGNLMGQGFQAGSGIANLYNTLGMNTAQLQQQAAQARAAAQAQKNAGWGNLIGAGIGALAFL